MCKHIISICELCFYEFTTAEYCKLICPRVDIITYQISEENVCQDCKDNDVKWEEKFIQQQKEEAERRRVESSGPSCELRREGNPIEVVIRAAQKVHHSQSKKGRGRIRRAIRRRNVLRSLIPVDLQMLDD